jgi:hypothetical protein
MTSFRICALFVIAVLANGVALRADDASPKLPEDGWWVRYYVTWKHEQANDEITFKRTYSLVGTTTENDQRCRWVEMKTVQTVNGIEGMDVIKFLVPERELLQGEKPLESLLRCWRRTADGQVQAQRFSQPLGVPGFSSSADFAFGRDFVVFPGPRKKFTVVDERKVIEYQHGRLEIAKGRASQHTATRQALTNGEKQDFTTNFTVWDHSKLAPAYAALSARIDHEKDGVLIRTISMEFAIEDFGTDARSALPENN